MISKSTSTACPFLEIFGDSMCVTTGTLEIRAAASCTTASKAGVPARTFVLWMNRLSAARGLKPASRIRSIRPDSPGPDVFGLGFFVPIMPPMPKATTTRSSQPKVAVFQWFALQRPMRAARLRVCLLLVVRDIAFSPFGGYAAWANGW